MRRTNAIDVAEERLNVLHVIRLNLAPFVLLRPGDEVAEVGRKRCQEVAAVPVRLRKRSVSITVLQGAANHDDAEASVGKQVSDLQTASGEALTKRCTSAWLTSTTSPEWGPKMSRLITMPALFLKHKSKNVTR